jgi:hypothetical protein
VALDIASYGQWPNFQPVATHIADQASGCMLSSFFVSAIRQIEEPFVWEDCLIFRSEYLVREIVT